MRRVEKYAALSLGFAAILFSLFGCARLFNRAPVAHFTATPTSGPAPLTVTFDASESYDPDGEILGYEWDFGDNHAAFEKIKTHTYTTPGSYMVKLTTYDNQNAADSITQTITVFNSPPKAAFTYSPNPAQACFTIIFDGSSSFDLNGYIKSYDWSITNTELGYEISLSGAIVHWISCWEGSYTVGLTVVDNDGASDTTLKTINVKALLPNYVHPGDILYHPAVYSDIAAEKSQKTEEGISAITGHVGIVDCTFHVIEAKESGVTDAHTVDEFVNRYRNAVVPEVTVLRVKGVPVYVRKKAVEFAMQQIGKQYDWDSILTLTKQISGSSYYCSELVWAAYEVGSGAHMTSDGTVYCGYVNLDAGDGSECTSWVITPNEIYGSGWTHLTGYLFPR